jgi:hypothetical protein
MPYSSLFCWQTGAFARAFQLTPSQRIALFLGVCVVVRVAIGVIFLMLEGDVLEMVALSVIAGLASMVFFVTAARATKPVWWSRTMHGTVLLAVATLAAARASDSKVLPAWVPGAVWLGDVGLGVVSLGWTQPWRCL